MRFEEQGRRDDDDDARDRGARGRKCVFVMIQGGEDARGGGGRAEAGFCLFVVSIDKERRVKGGSEGEGVKK